MIAEIQAKDWEIKGYFCGRCIACKNTPLNPPFERLIFNES
mgnify:CR=1 FL=1